MGVKLMKKYLSIILVISLVLSSFTVAFGTPKDVLGTDFEEAVAAMTALGIIDGFPDGTYRANETVTRAQMAKMLIVALGYGEVADNLQSQFKDVRGHWAESYISLASDLEIIQGYPDGSFKPNNKVSFNEAITMTMRTLGYVDEGLIGKWPTNYLIKAYDLELLKDVTMSSNYADRGNVAKIIFNALYNEYVELNENGLFVVNAKGEKLIQKLVSTEEVFLEYSDVYGEEKLASTISLEDYVFQNVVVYKNRVGQIVHVERSLSNVLMGRINSTSTGTNIRIEVEGRQVYQNIPLDENTRIMYNGFYGGQDDHTGITSGGTIDIVWQDRNGNGQIDSGEVDSIIIEKLDNKFVVTDAFDSSNFQIRGRKPFALNAFETIVIPKTQDDSGKDVVDSDKLIIGGDAETLEDIQPKDILYVYNSRDGKQVQIRSIRETVTGVIEVITMDNRIETSSASGRVVIDGKIYTLASALRPYFEGYANRWAVNPESTQDKFVPGAEVVLLLDDVGYAYSFFLLQEAEGPDHIGMVIATKQGSITEQDNGFVGDEFNLLLPQVQLVNQEGKIQTLTVDKDAAGVVHGTPVFDVGDNTTTTALTINVDRKDIIQYKVDEAGMITSIVKKDLDTLLNDVETNKRINVVGGKYIIDDQTLMFDAIGNARLWKTLSLKEIHNRLTGVALLRDNGFSVDIMRIDEGEYTTPVSEGVFAVIQSMSFALNDNNKEIAQVRVYESGMTKTYNTDENNSRTLLNLNNEFFELVLNEKNEIAGIKQVEEKNDNVENVFKLSRIKGVYNENSLISVSLLDDEFNEMQERFKPLADDVVIYRLNYNGNELESITVGSQSDLVEGRLVKGYDLRVDNNEVYDVVFVATNKEVTMSNLPVFMVYDIAFADGSGTAEDPYIIMTASHLRNVNSDLEAYYKLMSHIDLESIENWTPIGDNSSTYDRFKGYFDGNGYTISNLTITGSADAVGLFGRIENATIKNLTLNNAQIIGGEYTGALVGWSTNGLIINCHVNGVVQGTSRVGGLVGHAFTSSIEQSSANVDVTGTASNSQSIGGLVGNSQNSSFSKCYATGNVTGIGASSRRLGGLAGRAWEGDSFVDSYATGNVSGNTEIGGLIGYLRNNGTITNSYSTGEVSGNTRVGGLLGWSFGVTLPDAVTDSYWDTESSGTADSRAGEGKTTAEMQQVATFDSWNTSIWVIVEGSYPSLVWE